MFHSIVIAGATGGIGRELVLESLSRWPEATVWAIGRSPEKLQNLSDEARSPNLKTLAFSVADMMDGESFAATFQEKFSGIDLAFYTIGTLNASGHRPEKSLREIVPTDISETIQVNALGAIAFAAAIKPILRSKPLSRFITLSAKVGSIADNHLGGWYGYRMSKAALNMGLKNVAIEFQRSGCNSIVCAVHPGTTLTAFSEDHVKGWPADKLSDPRTTAKRLLDLSVTLEPKHNGKFLHWDGTELPW